MTEQNSAKKYKIGYTCGVFDLLHVGHLNLLERCKAMCEKLVVGVCDDDYVRTIKKKEPAILENDRVRMLKALKVVDDAFLVTIEETDDKLKILEKIHFDVLFSGDDWKGSERYILTEKQFEKYGVAIEYLPYTKGISTTQLKESFTK
jgi:glycerol-3-phosphate cytidylyltransferase